MAPIKSLFFITSLTKLLPTSHALSVPPPTSKTQPLQVWDGVLPDANLRQTLHDFASRNGLGHACFSRPLTNREQRNPIELVLDAVLNEIESGYGREEEVKPHFVEYWSRQEWRHIEAHADVDETLAKVHDKAMPPMKELQTKYASTFHDQTGGYRYPTHGHVLYLQIGRDVKGPTVVFPGYSSGGDLYSKNDCANNNDCIDKEAKTVQVISIPAVSGRLLRFNGKDIHAVPRPHDLWLLPFVSGSADFEPEEQWGRSVILFNIWPGEEDPPLDVPLDAPSDSSVDCQSFSTEELLCNKYSDWESVPISQPREEDLELTDVDAKQSMKVWLVGNERRRDYTMRTVPLLCPERGGQNVVRVALAEGSKVTRLWLRQT